MSELVALRRQIDSLTERLGRLENPGAVVEVAPSLTYTPEPEPIKYIPVHTARSYFVDNRELRTALEAIALSRGEPSPGRLVHPDWLPLLKNIAASRKDGLTWTKALEVAGLPLPNLERELPRLQSALRDVYADLPGIIQNMKRRGFINSIALGNLQKRLTELFT
jgi:hypothetical protein